MKPSFLLLVVFLLLARWAVAAPPKGYIDLVTAAAQQSATVAVKATGLGTDNLSCTITNKTSAELRVRVTPGLHFGADNGETQDLLTYQEMLLVLAPGGSNAVRLRGFCMALHHHGPYNSSYTLRGMAGQGLQPLADSLHKYPELAADYGQMLVWAVTDNSPLYAIDVPPSQQRGATNVVRYVSQLTGQKAGAVTVSKNARPSVQIFSKSVYVRYHSPKEQVASLRIFGADGSERHVVKKNWKLMPGLVRYNLALNAVLGRNENPVYYIRLLDAAGKLLQEVKVDNGYAGVDVEPTRQPFVFDFSLSKPVKNARLRVRLPDGTLAEELKQLPYLPAGDHHYKWAFNHTYPAGTAFVVRLETEAGALLKQQPITDAPFPLSDLGR